MTPDQRYRWITEYIRAPGYGMTLDILNTDFVLAYGEATGVKLHHCAFGAPKCPTLARDLLQMKKDYRLTRKRVGIEGMGGMGFPKWVWSYRYLPPPEWLAEIDAREALTSAAPKE